MASVTEEARKKANLRMLQRTCDASITDILASSAHVVLYEFAQASWSKSDVEGSLFLTTTNNNNNTGGGFTVVILNRHSQNNFIMPLTATLQLQHQDPYLICRRMDNNNKPLIQGIWFHNAQDRVALTHALESIVQSLKQEPTSNQNTQINAMPPQSPANNANTPARTADATGPSSSSGTTQNTFSTPISAMLAAAHQSSPAAGAAYSSPPPSNNNNMNNNDPGNNNTVTADERAHLANLLSQTTIAAATATPTPAPESTTNAATNAAAASSTQLPGDNVALDKRSLQLALLSLIQDDRFLDLLHSQYLRVVKARNNKGGSG